MNEAALIEVQNIEYRGTPQGTVGDLGRAGAPRLPSFLFAACDPLAPRCDFVEHEHGGNRLSLYWQLLHLF